MRQIRIGIWPDLSFPMASAEWERLRNERVRGQDPALAKRRERQATRDAAIGQTGRPQRHLAPMADVSVIEVSRTQSFGDGVRTTRDICFHAQASPATSNKRRFNPACIGISRTPKRPEARWASRLARPMR